MEQLIEKILKYYPDIEHYKRVSNLLYIYTTKGVAPEILDLNYYQYMDSVDQLGEAMKVKV